MPNILSRTIRYDLGEDPLPVVDALPRPLRIDLGGGRHPLPGWLNVDMYHEADIIMDLSKPFPFRDNSVDEYNCIEVIEHLEPPCVDAFAMEMYRTLKPGGTLVLECPNSAECFVLMHNGLNYLYCLTSIVGGGMDAYDYHRTLFWEKLLDDILGHAGFKVEDIAEEMIEKWKGERSAIAMRGFTPEGFAIVKLNRRCTKEV
jgi:predicted SAM-dependent methyltransferase